MPPTLSVLVLGAGELGTAVLKALPSHPGHGSISVLLRPFTLASSDPSRVAQLASISSLGASFLAGDIVNDAEHERVTLTR